MSSSHYFYVGAFLILNNIHTKTIVSTRECSKHGKVHEGSNFCHICGEKIETIQREIGSRKSYYSYTDRKYDDLMFAPENISDDKIILIPNKICSGEVQDIEDSVFIDRVKFINEPIIEECKDKLEETYKEYIDWLVNVQKFDVVTSFGTVEYYN